MAFTRLDHLEYIDFKSAQFGTQITVGYGYTPADPDQGVYSGEYYAGQIVLKDVDITEHLSEMCIDFVEEELVSALKRSDGPATPRGVLREMAGVGITA